MFVRGMNPMKAPICRPGILRYDSDSAASCLLFGGFLARPALGCLPFVAVTKPVGP